MQRAYVNDDKRAKIAKQVGCGLDACVKLSAVTKPER
jgi:hypothetical protein